MPGPEPESPAVLGRGSIFPFPFPVVVDVNIERVTLVGDSRLSTFANRLTYIAGSPIDLGLSLSRRPLGGLRQNRMPGRFSLRLSSRFRRPRTVFESRTANLLIRERP